MPTPRTGPANVGNLSYGYISMPPIIFDIIGMSGTVLVVSAFFCLQLKKIKSESLQYN